MQAESVADLLPLHLRKSYILIAERIGNSQVRNSFGSPTRSDVLAWWDSGMPRSLVPVFVDKNDELIDYYCLNFENGSPVVVFCDHAIVNCWDSVDGFITWLTVQT
jgi:hypothetical protein